ncbi:restriction system modified-DNA reader domain-containing protein [Georgenia subflava]|uniref:RAMA domain-containing protein n=1 Tax=Georgenia subflava TaxID=1622177 RepID=A0A6N7EU23_9MICO|nr:hypothetical protein [Georgenia subflava]MPV38644.1 hypothetical protein [Georgenia subflava]
MPFFEFDDGRLVPARFGYSVAAEIEPSILEAVRNQVLEVVERPLFPVSWHGDGRRTGTYRDSEAPEPRLTAMDPSGQVVTVEVVERLSPAALVDALSRSGRNADMGWTELGGMYPRGMAAFRRDWNIFRESMPPRPAPGPRLIIVAGAVEDEVRPALEVLGRSGVVVHEIRLRQMPDGSQLLDVDELRPDVVRYTGTILSADTQRREVTAGPPDAVTIARERTAAVPREVQATAAARAEQTAAADRAAGDRGVPAVGDQSVPAAGDQSVPAAGDQGAPAAGGQGAADEGPAAERSAPTGQAGAAADLALIAAALESETDLLWSQHRRGIRHEATLTPDGVVRLPGGATFTDPDLAARAASGRDDVDGWRVWRFGEVGPSLAEARAELVAARGRDGARPGRARAGRRRERSYRRT